MLQSYCTFVFATAESKQRYEMSSNRLTHTQRHIPTHTHTYHEVICKSHRSKEVVEEAAQIVVVWLLIELQLSAVTQESTELLCSHTHTHPSTDESEKPHTHTKQKRAERQSREVVKTHSADGGTALRPVFRPSFSRFCRTFLVWCGPAAPATAVRRRENKSANNQVTPNRRDAIALRHTTTNHHTQHIER